MNSPIKVAISKSNIQMVEFLFHNGAESCIYYNGVTEVCIFDVAIESRNTEIMKIVISNMMKKSNSSLDVIYDFMRIIAFLKLVLFKYPKLSNF